ncbi:TrbC/VirB2 family protein (plasmid) [Macrococcoides canis]|uniref:TrbC/VirB2 family protein n=1 Tax=Staphylococcaceae TaxID=90964 RepID=UPI001CCCA4B0|nr:MULTISPECIES: TrbC/VirB2 family protein [Macrococcus]UBH16618.1 TrbC/VirB2 family protein [Macrococcus armenti]UBH21252.1 TrbC/VirB2 family protein [Macrococcus armenti]UJS29060.1 TrbC/VirB2 family protein [Macrococcus canis]
MVENIISTVEEFLNALQLISIPVAGIMFVIAGYQFLRGGDEGPTKAKKMVFYIIVGLVIIWGASSLVSGIKERITF